jgi:hypothetical protein
MAPLSFLLAAAGRKLLVASYPHTGGLPRNAPPTSATSVNTKKMKNKIFAIPAAAPAMLVNPNTAAMMATMKNVKAHDNMTTS